jgi:hypothetical protein
MVAVGAEVGWIEAAARPIEATPFLAWQLPSKQSCALMQGRKVISKGTR